MGESRVAEEGLPSGATAAMSAIYEEAIEATISACASIQNPKVLLAIEKQWRQALRRRRLEVKRALAKRNLETEGAKDAPVADSAAQSADQPTASSSDASAKPEGGLEGTGAEKSSTEGGGGECQGGQGKAQEGTAASNEQTEDSEDDFADAEVDEAEEGAAAVTSAASAASLPPKKRMQNSLPVSAAPAAETNLRVSQGEKTVVSEDEGSGTEDFEEGASLTALDVSDLEDAEPKTLDALFAFYDKIGGNEMPFDALYGDFTF